MRARAREKLRSYFRGYRALQKHAADESWPNPARLLAYSMTVVVLGDTKDYLNSKTAKGDMTVTCRSKLLKLVTAREKE
jgi:hypothetical protein